MAKQTRQKKSTVANLVATAQINDKPVAPPIQLDEAESAVFQGVLSSRERDTWSDHDLREAAKLAKLQIRFDKEWADLEHEGFVIMNHRGTEIENPRNRVCMTMQSTIKSLSSSLGLTASQRGVAGGKQAGRNEREINSQRAAKKDKGLLA